MARSKWSNFLRLSALMLLVLFAVSLVEAQSAAVQTNLRVAETLERAGDFQHALQLYRELAARDPSNPMYDEALERLLVQLKQYDEALAIHKRSLVRTPDDLMLQVSLGTLCYRAGHEEDSFAEWDHILDRNPRNPVAFSAVAAAEIECRLLDHAIATFRRGQDDLGDPSLFAPQLSSLLAAMMDYRGASAELLLWFAKNPTQLPYIQGRMSTFTSKPEGRQAAISAVQDALRQKEMPQLYELLGWLYLEGKEFEQALDAYTAIDRLVGSNGTGLLMFADRVLREKGYAIAARAYRSALALALPENRRPSAMFGYASALEGESNPPDSTTIGVLTSGTISEVQNTQPAVNAFAEVAARYPNTELAAKALLRIGIVKMERNADLDGARQALEQVRATTIGSPTIRYGADLQLGKLCVIAGDTTQARVLYASVESRPDATPDQTDEAGFRIAELEYFAGRFKDALARLDSISFNVRADYANDALTLKAFLLENQGSPDALLQFAHADLIARRHHTPEAIALFQDVVQGYPHTLLVDDALMKMALLQTDAGLFEQAVATYRTLLDKYKETSIAPDRAQFNMAELYERGLKDPTAAIKAYEQILSGYPNSLLVDEARRRVRILRGEVQ